VSKKKKKNPTKKTSGRAAAQAKKKLPAPRAAAVLTELFTEGGAGGPLTAFVKNVAAEKVDQVGDALEAALLSQVLDAHTYPALTESITRRRNGQIVEGPTRDLVDSGELGESIGVAKNAQGLVEVYVFTDFAEALNDYIGFFDMAIRSVNIGKVLDR
jgi:hypothetical protein